MADVFRFRWAVCQLDALKPCFNLPTLRKALKSLPKTLDETYSRILCDIAEEHRDYAIRILQWLTYSARPLRIEELAETIAVNIESNPWFDYDARFPEHRDILLMCSGLVTIEGDSEDDSSWGSDDKPTSIVRLAHFSVKEYLVSERIRTQAAKEYAIREIHANKSIASVCLAYLLQFDQHDNLTLKAMTEFPLARYAAQYWFQHVKIVGKDLDSIQMLSMELFYARKTAYINWVRLCDPDRPWRRSDLRRDPASIANPLYYASLNGVIELMQLLLEEGADVNAQGGFYGNALQAASSQNDEIVIRLLLNKGADVNAQGGHYGNALQAASFHDNETTLRLLLDKGADVNAQGGYYGNALQAALFHDNETAVQLLLSRGADINAQGGYYDNALQTAPFQDNETAIRLLLDKGADVNTQGGRIYGNALQAASV